MGLPITPSQTVGPYFAIGLTWSDGAFVVPEGTEGAVRITGQVLDEAGEPVPDAMIETWQADPEGCFNCTGDPRGVEPGVSPEGFLGFGRCPTNSEGWFSILTVKPGPLPIPDGRVEAPHIDVSVFARGLLNRVVTRIYFPDETEANAADPVLSTVGIDRRATLIAARQDDEVLRFDVRLRGEGETVFFDV